MEDIDFFEDWDPMVEELEELEELEESLEDVEVSESESDQDSDDCDSDDNGDLTCSKCGKLYHVKGWLARHEISCSGENKTTKRKKKKMSTHQKKTREILANLGFDEYFDDSCLPVIVTTLQQICDTPNDKTSLRGARFAKYKTTADNLIVRLDNSDAAIFFKYVSQRLWTICFSKDGLLSSSRRSIYVVQGLTAFRQSTDLTSRWTALNLGNDQLLLHKVITVIFEDICEYRAQCLEKELHVRDEYMGETANKPILGSVEKDIVAYVGGYVCRKTRDRLQRYIYNNHSSKKSQVQVKCQSLGVAIKTINTMVPGGVETQSSAMSFPNLMTLSLTRGGLTQIDNATFTFFCYVELSIRPFLNLATFRSSNRNSDSALLDQLIENSTLLKPAWPFSSSLPPDDSNLLLKLFVGLYYRVRKWAYLKVYKEHKKFEETLTVLKSKAQSSVNLHGKDSIRKALMTSVTQ